MVEVEVRMTIEGLRKIEESSEARGAGGQGARVLLHGCYNTRNFGDLLLLELLTRYVRRTFDADAVSPWLCLPVARGLSCRPGHGLLSCLHARAAIFGGGGYFTDHGGEQWAIRKLLRYSVPAAIWRMLRIPYVISGVGVGPLTSEVGRNRVRSICVNAEAVAVRDAESRAVLIEAGVPEGKVSVTGDWVAGLTAGDLPEWASGRAAEILGPRDTSVFRLGLHFESLSSQGALLERAMSAIGDSLPTDRAVEAWWIVDHNMDSGLKSRVLDATRLWRHPLRLAERESFWTTAAVIGNMDLVMTSKLHVGIAAWALGVPPCGYSTHEKSRRFYRQIGRPQFQADSWVADPCVLGRWVTQHLDGLDRGSIGDPESTAVVRRNALRNRDTIATALGSRLGPR